MSVPLYSCGFTGDFMGIYWKRLGCIREGIPVLPEHSPPSPQATESDPNQEAAPKNLSLMQEGGRIELRRVSARLTAYKAVSSPNGLRLPHRVACASLREGIGKTLEAPARIELATPPLRVGRSFHLRYGASRYEIIYESPASS